MKKKHMGKYRAQRGSTGHGEEVQGTVRVHGSQWGTELQGKVRKYRGREGRTGQDESAQGTVRK